jgi:(S)-citramalyl-CoA lyase
MSRPAGVEAIDAPYFDLRDQAGLERAWRRSCAPPSRSASPKAAIHPGQVAAINAALTPSAAAGDEARESLAQNAKGGGGGRMVDEAVARRARRILAVAGGAA